MWNELPMSPLLRGFRMRKKYIQAKPTCKELCLKYTCGNYTMSNNPLSYLQVPFRQYCQLHLCKLRWLRHRGGKMCVFMKDLWEHFLRPIFNILCVYVHIAYVLLRQTFNQRYLGQMTSFIVCKLSYLIWLGLFIICYLSNKFICCSGLQLLGVSTPVTQVRTGPWDSSFFILPKEVLRSVYFS